LNRSCKREGCPEEFESKTAHKKYCSTECRVLDDLKSKEGALPEEALEKIGFLRKENARLATLAKRNRQVSEEISFNITSLIEKHVKQLVVKPPKEKTGKVPKDELIANPWNADTQIGKVTPSYNTSVATGRVQLYTDQILNQTNLLRNAYSIKEARVWFLGDIIEGEGIFPAQAHVIDASVYEQVAKTAPAIYGEQLVRLLETFDRVHVVGVIGNHGRLERTSNPESNMERIFYKVLQHMFAKEPRITFNIPDGNGESMFWAIDKIGNYSTLLIHGDQLPNPMNLNGYWTKILGWKTSGMIESFDDVAMGHWHQASKITIGKTVVRISGTLESHNTFAQESLGIMGKSSQHLQMISPENGVVWESDIYIK